MFNKSLAPAALALALITAPASATTLEVVSGPTGQRAFTLPPFGPVGQSFTAFDTDISSIGFQWETFNPTHAAGPVTLSLVSGATLDGPALFTTSFQPTGISTAATWFDVDVTGWQVTAGQTYTLVLSSLSDLNGLVMGPEINIYTGEVLGTDAYAGGTALFQNPPYGTFCETSGLCDLNFRMTATTPTAAVPEPSTWAMLTLGFGLLGGALRAGKRRTAVSFA